MMVCDICGGRGAKPTRIYIRDEQDLDTVFDIYKDMCPNCIHTVAKGMELLLDKIKKASEVANIEEQKKFKKASEAAEIEKKSGMYMPKGVI